MKIKIGFFNSILVYLILIFHIFIHKTKIAIKSTTGETKIKFETTTATIKVL
jgi:hypothetical protein